MRNKALVVLALIFAVVLVGCESTGTIKSPYDYDHELAADFYAGYFSNEEVEVTAKAAINTFNFGSAHSIEVEIKNKTDRILTLDYNQSLFTNTSSEKVVDGETRKIDSQKVQPNYPIGPGTSIKRIVCNADVDKGFFLVAGKPALLLALVDGSEVEYVQVDLALADSVDYNPDLEKVGEVSIEKTNWHFLFIGDSLESAMEELQKEAIKQYGENAVINNVRYEKNWSAFSLLLYFNILGYVDKIIATADVCIPAAL